MRGFAVPDTDDFAALMAPFETYSKGYTAGTSERQAIKGQVMKLSGGKANPNVASEILARKLAD